MTTTSDSPFLTIGTRGSPLALAQARLTAAALVASLGIDIASIAITPITTTGDATQDRPLSEIGGKGLFTKEIDLAQLQGRVDLAVHSAKDLPTELPPGLVIGGYLEREDARDALVSPRYRTLAALPPGARVGTISLRRQSLVRKLRPDLKVEALRGNVGTRLAKVHGGDFDAVILAMAGLKRLGLAHEVTEALNPAIFVPAVGQGAIALVIREGDRRMIEALAGIIHAPTAIELAAERAFLKVLDGSCRTPIGGHARVSGAHLTFSGIVLSPDGQIAVEIADAAEAASAAALGARLGRELATKLPPGFNALGQPG
jgi:hydroxymethylbilane synthase